MDWRQVVAENGVLLVWLVRALRNVWGLFLASEPPICFALTTLTAAQRVGLTVIHVQKDS